MVCAASVNEIKNDKNCKPAGGQNAGAPPSSGGSNQPPSGQGGKCNLATLPPPPTNSPLCPAGTKSFACESNHGCAFTCATSQAMANDTTAGFKNCQLYGPDAAAPLNLKPSTQMASVAHADIVSSVPDCKSKPPFLPWGGTGSATITVTGGQPCGIGWHDTGATILDSMSVTSPPSHGSLKPQDQHVIIFTPAPGYKGQDSFMLSMQEHNGGRRATLKVRVSVTIEP